MHTIINGKEIANSIYNITKKEVETAVEEYAIKPCLSVITVGDDPASKVYVTNKKKACEKVGITFNWIEVEETITQEALDAIIIDLNKDEKVHGILLQLPIPKHLDKTHSVNLIDPIKDVDGFNYVNLGKIISKDEGHQSCTPKGIMYLLKEYNINPEGKHAVIIGRSVQVSKPMAMMLLNANATVTICHSKTKDLHKHIMQADILVCAVGKANFISNPEIIKKDAVIIDVGINRNEEGKLCGDVCATDKLLEQVSYITPVPGGVGPMTVAMLIRNTLDAYYALLGKE